MPICSYIVYPRSGKKNIAENQLSKLQHCEVVAAQNRELLILTTETFNKKQEKELQEKLCNLECVENFALSFAHWGE
ncbi:chaperone NapD [Candidatus Uabimicrobium sp. HlEnr_7]|uniref:chaperone NapD n=1 Tax=Candidatus Uabimicrobium helgolandensis TaxID=3095367 RepID=UPI003557FD69